MGITKEQIYAIADTLNKEGIKPTLAAVRRRLGSGSFTTISEAVNEWKLNQRCVAEMPQEAIPEMLKEYLHQLGAAIWAEATNTANRRLSQEQEAMVEKFNEKETYYSELEKLATDYDTELEAAKACIEDLRNEVAETAKKLNSKEKECVKMQQILNQKESEQRILEQRNSELKQELVRSYDVTDKLQKNLADLISNFDAMQRQFNAKISPSLTQNKTGSHTKITS